MSRGRYVLQVYTVFPGGTRGEWQTCRKTSNYSFLHLCELGAGKTKRDKIGRQILSFPGGIKLAVFKFGEDRKYYEGYSRQGAELRNLLLESIPR